MAITAAGYRHASRTQGRRHGTPDALLAALTKHAQAVLLTHNSRDFPTQDITVQVLASPG